MFELVQKDGSNRPAEKCVGAWGSHCRGLLSGMGLLKIVRYYVLLYKALGIYHLCTILIVPSQEKLTHIVEGQIGEQSVSLEVSLTVEGHF